MVRDRLLQLKADAKAAGWSQYIRTENDEKALLAGCRVNLRRALHVVDFFPRFLRHWQGVWEGKPFELATFQREDIVIPLMGWEDKNGKRRFTRGGIWMPKKHGKSPLASGLSLYHLTSDREKGPLVLLMANSKDQAGNVFSPCACMVEASPELSAELTVIRGTQRILYGNNAMIRVAPAEPRTSHGPGPSLWVFDEIHAFGERGREVREAYKYAGRARAEPMELIISSAGDEESSVGLEEYTEHKQILAGQGSGGIEDLHTFVYIAEADPKDDWTKPETWRKANPAIGVIFDEEVVRRECAEAQQKPRLVNTFKRYCLGVWTATEEIWLRPEDWKQCAAEIDEAELIGLPCCAAIDASSKIDLSALTLMFRQEDGYFTMLSWTWLPADGIADREREDRMPYRRLANDGWIDLCEGPRIRQTDIEAKLLELHERYSIQRIYYDPKYWKDTAERMESERSLPMMPFDQNIMQFTGPTKEFEAIVRDHKLRHPNSPIVNRAAVQTSVWRDANDNIRPLKSDRHKRRKRIDPIVAGIMALAGAMVVEPAGEPGLYVHSW